MSEILKAWPSPRPSPHYSLHLWEVLGANPQKASVSTPRSGTLLPLLNAALQSGTSGSHQHYPKPALEIDTEDEVTELPPLRLSPRVLKQQKSNRLSLLREAMAEALNMAEMSSWDLASL